MRGLLSHQAQRPTASDKTQVTLSEVEPSPVHQVNGFLFSPFNKLPLETYSVFATDLCVGFRRIDSCSQKSSNSVGKTAQTSHFRAILLQKLGKRDREGLKRGLHLCMCVQGMGTVSYEFLCRRIINCLIRNHLVCFCVLQ